MKVYSDNDVHAFRKILTGRPVRVKTKDGNYEYVYYKKGDTQYKRAEEWESYQLQSDPFFTRISDAEPTVLPQRVKELDDICY